MLITFHDVLVLVWFYVYHVYVYINMTCLYSAIIMVNVSSSCLQLNISLHDLYALVLNIKHTFMFTEGGTVDHI